MAMGPNLLLDTYIFYDAIVLLDTFRVNQAEKTLRLLGYTVNGTEY